MMKFKLMQAKAFNAFCAEIGQATGSLRANVQSAAVIAVGYSLLHRDTGAANRLIDSISAHKTIRKDSLVAFLEKFGAVKWDNADKTLHFRERTDGVEFSDEYVELMNANPWSDAKREAAPVSIYDVEAAFGKFLKSVHKYADDTAVMTRNRALLAVMERAYHKYIAEQADEQFETVVEKRKPDVVEPTIPEPTLVVVNG
jgi:hypothetical protein